MPNQTQKVMEQVNVMITGAGAPGAPGIIKSLRLNGEREIRIIGVDIDDHFSSGMGMVDQFYKIPTPDNESVFIGKVLEIARKHEVKVIIPLVTRELFVFSKCIHQFLKYDIQVLVSDYKCLQIANDKFELMTFCAANNIPVPEFYKVNSPDEFRAAAKKLSFPEKMICFKPPVSNGLRGFRIITPPGKVDKMDLLLNQKPNDVFMGFDEFENIIQQSNYFPELLVMEYLEGMEYSVDVLADHGTCIEVIPRSRDKIKMGISFAATLIKDEKIIAYSRQIVTKLGLHGNIGLQFKNDSHGEPKILESNPRVQGTIVFNTAAGFNMVYNAVKVALREEIQMQPIKWDMKMVRYWEEIYYYHGERISI
jgi:carbamoyl-phosphate synthase large subunit